MQSNIGVAIVGTGFGEKVHIPGFKAHPRTEVVAVYHRDLQKAQAIAFTHNIPHACTTIEDIVALPEVQAVSISTPPFLHYEMAKTVLQAGKHLLLEKPTALSAIEARELYQLTIPPCPPLARGEAIPPCPPLPRGEAIPPCPPLPRGEAIPPCPPLPRGDKGGIVATLDFEFRFVPAWQLFSEYLAEGYVGQPRLIKIDWLVSSRADASRPWNWYARKETGGGALGAIGSHAFDYISWLFGPVRRLCAHLSTAIPARPDPKSGEMKPVDADDTCLIMLQLQDGTPVQVCLSSVTYQGRGHWVEVYGDRGTLVLGSDNQKDYVHGFRLWAAPAGKSLTEVPIPNRLEFPKNYADGRIAPFIRVVDRWVQSIDRGEEMTPGFKEGVYSQLLMDLTHQSQKMGRWIDVPDLETFLSGNW